MTNSGKLLTACGFGSFFVFGFIDNLKGPLLPEILLAEQLSYSQGGTLLLAAYLGFILATLSTGVMADVGNNRVVLLAAGILLCGGIVGLGATNSYWLMIALMGIVGLGLGAIEVGGSGLMVELHGKQRARYLNLLATCHGVGSLLVPLYVAWLINIGLTWQRIYLSTALLAALLTLIFAIVSGGSDGESNSDVNWNWTAVRRAGFTRRMCWYYVLIASYVAMELGTAAWMVEYLQQVRGLSVTHSSLYLSGFFATIMIGRLLGSFVVERVDYRRLIGVALIGGTSCLAAGIFGSDRQALLLPISGLFFSIIFPTATAAVSDLHEANVGSVLGILFTFGGVGGALGPWTVGLISQWQGLQIGMASTLGFGLTGLVALGALTLLDRRE